MSDLAVTRVGGGHGRTALMLGVASLVLYIGVGFTVGGIFWALGPIVGLGAIVLGVAARRRGGGHEATIANRPRRGSRPLDRGVLAGRGARLRSR